MSVRRHAVVDSDSSNQCRRKNSNLTSSVEELPRPQQREVAHCQEDSPVAPLRAQLALEYRLQSLCQRLLESYKDQQDWAAVGQVAQSLVTNTQRVSLLKERLLSGSYSILDHSRRGLKSITELPFADTPDGRTLLSLISEADGDEEGTEEAADAGTGSGSESSSAGKAFETLTHVSLRSPAAAASAETAESDSSSGASSAVDYETASQQTSTSSEVEPDTSTTGLESSETRSKTGSEPSLVQLSSGASNTPSPEHLSSCSSSSGGIECSTPPIGTPQDIPPLLEEPPDTDSIPEAEPQSQGEEGEGEERESKCGESVMETLKPKAAGGVGSGVVEETVTVETNYVEMHPGVRTTEGAVIVGEGGGEGERSGTHGDSSDSGVEGTVFHGKLFAVCGLRTVSCFVYRSKDVYMLSYMFNGMMFVGGAAYCEGLCTIT